MGFTPITRKWHLHFCFLCLASLLSSAEAQLNERERLHEHAVRYNNTWPPEISLSEGWKHNMHRRLAQVERIENSNDRYNGFISTLAMAHVVPNFTEHGWGLTRAPEELVKQLRVKLHAGLEQNPKEEKYINVISGDQLPLFIPNFGLNARTLKTLKPMHEEWSGVKLVGAMAYGLRAYRNNSALWMHVDRPKTHVISCILHVDHSEDSEPWPLFIEDFQGNTNEVYLESGDMLFYESSKCIHGRPRPLKGSWYSSLFVHYYPVNWDSDNRIELDAHYAVPPHWSKQQPADDRLDDLIMSGTSFIEPNCPDNWCGTQKTTKWYGPAKDGTVISTGYTEEDAKSEEL